MENLGSKSFKRNGVYVTDPVLSDGTASFTPSGEVRGGVKTTFHSSLKNDDIQTSSSQVIGAAKAFDAFGNELSSSGAWKSQFGYAGKFGYQQDPDSGLKLLGHRYYDSSTGRFLTRDPIKDGRNWYSYCGNNPISYTDANGLAKIWLAWREVGNTGHYHALIIIKDEDTGQIWVFEGGPTPELMLDGGGRAITDGEEYNRIMAFEKTLIHDDDESGEYWNRRARNARPKRVPYLPFNSGALDQFASGNSNSWVRELLERLKLPRKLPKNVPSLPKWHDDPWSSLPGRG